MITLTNERGLIYNPKSWDEIEAIPGYVKGLNSCEHKLKAIIGSYDLKSIHCGLSECNRAHDKGYIAQTIKGSVTNIGHICGSKYFGVDFTTYANQHKRDVEEQFNRELLTRFVNTLEVLENEVVKLRKGECGADWIYKTSQELISIGKRCPDAVVREVLSMIKSESNTLEKIRVASDNEVKSLEMSQSRTLKRPHYVTDKLAIIRGLETLHETYDLKSLLITDLSENIKSFKLLKVDNLSHSELNHWAKWVKSIESTKEKIQHSMSAGMSLLRHSNLKPFIEIITSQEDISQFNKLLETLPE